VEDVTNMSLLFPHKRFATIQSSWLEPRKIREMTIVGSQRMIVYDDLRTREKIRIYDVRVERPPHYDTFAEFHYSYHYGDSYIPHLQQEEPLALACRHFIECIETNSAPMTGGRQGLEMIRLLEGASASLKTNGAPFIFGSPNGSALAHGPIGNGDGSVQSPKPKTVRRGSRLARNGVTTIWKRLTLSAPAIFDRSRQRVPDRRDLAKRVPSLPMFPESTEDQIEYAAFCVGEAVGVAALA
jgi:hypothetical protein